MPVIQGYCKIAHCVNTFEDEEAEEGSEDRRVAPFPPEEFELVLISRRSVNRAGKCTNTTESLRVLCCPLAVFKKFL